jgi:hemoglobin/transferrin/lactoferrin receptor protein
MGHGFVQGQSDSIRMETEKGEVLTQEVSKALEWHDRKDSEPFQTVKSDGLTPIPFVVVFNKNSGQSVMTDINGNATVLRATMSDTLIFQSIGFMDMVVYPGNRIPEKIRLIEDLISLGTAEVVSQGLVDAQDASLSMRVDGAVTIPRPVVPLEVPQNSAELLWATGSVMVQQSQQGGGSPILRGFEANRILLVVDGVRMNNAIYRSGHLQNAITVDSQVLERTDVLLGPNSILFGSDALGGVIHYHTRTPKLGAKNVSIRSSMAYRTPNSGRSGHIDVEVSRLGWASLTSISRSVYGDLQMGRWRMHGDATWGLDSLYVERINGKDSMRVNESPEMQKGSGYQQTDFLQKFRFRAGPGILDVNFQFSTSSNVPRYDVSSDWSNNQLKWAEWDYGPQKRFLTSAKYARQLHRWNVSWESQVALQQIEESRIKRRFGEVWREIQTEDVRVLNGYTTLNKRWYSGLSVTAGLSAAWDDVTSRAKQVHVADTDSLQTAMTRYPSGGSSLTTQGIFATAQWPWRAHRIAAGIRWSQSQLKAQFLPNERYTLPFDRLNTKNGALTGGISGQWNGTGPWMGMTSLSTGFRHPNVDDVGKVREKGGFVMIPNDSLQPEYLTSLEQGLTWNLQNRDIMLFTITGFASFLNHAIVPQDASLNGASMFWIDGDSARVQTHVNADQAVIAGGRFEIKAQLSEKCGFETAVNWTWGRQMSKDEETSRPMAHIPPVFGRIALDYERRLWSVECNILFSAQKPRANFGGFATDNLDLMLATGAPAWWTFNVESELELHPSLKLRLGLRNIFDMHYRVFASGISAAGRGLYLSLNASF